MFYQYRQNNSGGSFDVDKSTGIGVIVIVEANSNEEADSRAQNIGIYFDGCDNGMDCDCCGDRWHRSWEKGDEVPTIYGEPIEEAVVGAFYSDAYVHYLDGTFKTFNLKQRTHETI